MIDFQIPEWIAANESDLKPLNPPLPKSVQEDMLGMDGRLLVGPFVVEASGGRRYLAMDLAVDAFNPNKRAFAWTSGVSHSHHALVKGRATMKDGALTFKDPEGETTTFRSIQPDDATWILSNADRAMPVREIVARLFPDGVGW